MVITPFNIVPNTPGSQVAVIVFPAAASAAATVEGLSVIPAGAESTILLVRLMPDTLNVLCVLSISSKTRLSSVTLKYETAEFLSSKFVLT